MNSKTKVRKLNKYLLRIAAISLFLFSMNSSALAKLSIAPDEAIPSFPSITFQSTSAADRESYEKLHGSDSECSYNVPPDYKTDSETALHDEDNSEEKDSEDSSAEYGEGPIKTNIAFIWSRILLKSAGIP